MRRRLGIGFGILAGAAILLFVVCFFGIWIPNEPSWESHPVRGIDVSHHQQEIDWNTVKAAGISFAYIKATEGADFTDGRFAGNWKGSEEAGLVRGAYHFFTFGSSGELQASHFISQVPAEANALPPAIDLEFSGYNKVRRPTPEEFQRELSAFWDAIFTHYHKSPVVYTTDDFQKRYLVAMPIEHLWIREVMIVPPRPWTFWQYSPRGRVKGVPTFVDLDVFHGTPAQFSKLTQLKLE